MHLFCSVAFRYCTATMAAAAAGGDMAAFYGHTKGKPFCQFSNFFPSAFEMEFDGAQVDHY